MRKCFAVIIFLFFAACGAPETAVIFDEPLPTSPIEALSPVPTPIVLEAAEEEMISPIDELDK